LKDWQKLALMVGIFLIVYFAPFEEAHIQKSILEAFYMLQYYVQEHVLFCLIPAFFIAGAIANFISQGAVIKYFGGKAKPWLAYSVASVSGSVLAVCSCTVLPLFSGIYRMGAGLGPAVAFLYSGPAINILAILLTARVLGWELGLARVVGAVLFAIVIGLLMAFFYRKEDARRLEANLQFGEEQPSNRKEWQNLVYFLVLILILIFATLSEPANGAGLFYLLWQWKWPIAVVLLILLGIMVVRWFDGEERRSWVASTWDFTQQILPLLFAGVLVAGLLMGRPESDAGLIPEEYIVALVGGNDLLANFIASLVGSVMYFATLTEVPILQGLIGSGMGMGPALALLLAGPALSLPNMMVIHSVLGTRKTGVFVVLVVIMATISGLIFGTIVG